MPTSPPKGFPNPLKNGPKFFKNPSKRKISSKSANIRDLEDVLKDKLGIRVLINNKKNNRGSISFEYKDLDQLNRLIDIIKTNY